MPEINEGNLQEIKNVPNIYECNYCHAKSPYIYTSKWRGDYKGTISCWRCGETEDSKYGINLNGKRIGHLNREKNDIFRARN